MNEHHQGVVLLSGSLFSASWAWYLANQQIINGTLYSAVLVVTLIGGVIGLRKVLRSR